MEIMDNTAIERIAGSDLAPDALALLRKYRDRDDVIFFLGRLVWQGGMADCVPDLLDIALDPKRGRYARIVSVRAVMSVGDARQQDRLWDSLADGAEPLDRRIFAELVEGAPPTMRSVDLLVRMIPRLEPHERFDVTGLDQALHGFIDRLPVMADSATDQPLARLIDGLNGFVSRPPFIERGECHVSEEFAWLMPAALHAVDRLVAGRARQALDAPSLAILLNMPALRFWRGHDMSDYQSALAENVPRWRELNDRLYWASIAEGRARLEKKGERLIDDWKVAFLGHFWRFGPDDFDRCLEWVASSEKLDDRLVAQSRCITLYVEADRPAGWRDRLIAASTGEAELEEALGDRLDPRPSPAVERMEEKHRAWKREREEQEAQEEQQRADWIRTLQSDPERVRRPEGLSPGEFSNDQFHLMMSIGDGSVTSRTQGADWRALIPEVGVEVAEAYRAAAIAHWRAYRPELRSEGADTSRTPYSLIFGMAGIAIESGEDPAFFERLDPDEARHALRYVTRELNGFPGWFEALYRAHPKVAQEAVSAELFWELEHTGAEPMHYILSDILHYAPWLHADVAPVIFGWLLEHDLANQQSLRHALSILTSGRVAVGDIARLAAAKIATVSEARPLWFALWVDTDPDSAIPALEAELERLDRDASGPFAQQFLVSLLGDRHGSGARFAAFRTAEHLKSLYVLMHRYVRAADDIDRANKGVYSPTLRDDAQDARNRLFQILSDIPGAETYAAIKALEKEHPDPGYRRWMAIRARQRAIADADEPAWTASRVHEFARQL
ncbi:MAG: hypothetical protein ACK4SZ_03095 [Allosphingosinicella sp.]|uniref:hypothetical protein n=1 Tax=Allosphingosinicella sp. TaxID=2823234 RepID=UPI0039625F78